MNDSLLRKNDKLGREDAFVVDNAADFPKDSPVDKLSKQINIERAKALDFDAAQTSGFGDQRQAQEIYETRRDGLIDLLDEFVLAAAIVDDDIEGTAAKFKNSYPRGDQKIIARAASFYNDSVNISSELTEAGLRSGGRDQLLTLHDEFQQAAAAHDTAEERHGEATGGMNAAFRQAMELSSRRDKRIRLKYRQNPAKLAAWEIASHLDRAPKGKGGTTPQPPTV